MRRALQVCMRIAFTVPILIPTFIIFATGWFFFFGSMLLQFAIDGEWDWNGNRRLYWETCTFMLVELWAKKRDAEDRQERKKL